MSKINIGNLGLSMANLITTSLTAGKNKITRVLLDPEAKTKAEIKAWNDKVEAERREKKKAKHGYDTRSKKAKQKAMKRLAKQYPLLSKVKL